MSCFISACPRRIATDYRQSSMAPKLSVISIYLSKPPFPPPYLAPASTSKVSISLSSVNHSFPFLPLSPGLLLLQPNYPLIAEYCNLWRNFGDIQDSWDSLRDIVDIYGSDKTNFTQVAGPGNWNDPDMVGGRRHGVMDNALDCCCCCCCSTVAGFESLAKHSLVLYMTIGFAP